MTGAHGKECRQSRASKLERSYGNRFSRILGSTKVLPNVGCLYAHMQLAQPHICTEELGSIGRLGECAKDRIFSE
jgi:hypothetical protein